MSKFQILIGLLNRDNANYPPIFIINEINRLMGNAPLYVFKVRIQKVKLINEAF